MGQDRDTKIALLIDFDNVALGARDAGNRFDIKLLLQRILEKGKVLVKKAYADWHYYKEHMSPLHEAAVELIEIPMPRISGKNSADIKLVVDAMDLCYSKDHIDTFVIVSGDSDFSPLVSKLRENNKWVIGVGVKNSSSRLLIGNCDEFIFYDDIFRAQARQASKAVRHVPEQKRELFDFLLKTTQSLLQESRGVLYSSLVKDTMTRKQPDFNERAYGYSNFGDLLEDARKLGLLVVERDATAGGTWVVHGMAGGSGGDSSGEVGGSSNQSGSTGSRPSRRRRRPSGRNRSSGEDQAQVTQSADSDTKVPGREGSEPQTSVTDNLPVAKGTVSDNGKSPTELPLPPVDEKPTGTNIRKKTTRKVTKKVGRGPSVTPEKKTAKKVNKKVTKKVEKKVVKKTVKKPVKKPAKKVTKKTEKKVSKKVSKKAGGAAGKK